MATDLTRSKAALAHRGITLTERNDRNRGQKVYRLEMEVDAGEVVERTPPWVDGGMEVPSGRRGEAGGTCSYRLVVRVCGSCGT